MSLLPVSTADGHSTGISTSVESRNEKGRTNRFLGVEINASDRPPVSRKLILDLTTLHVPYSHGPIGTANRHASAAIRSGPRAFKQSVLETSGCT